MSFFSPFRGIFPETNLSLHAHFLRTGLGKKIEAAFFVFFGYFWGDDLENHVGIFDVFTLFILLILGRLFLRTMMINNPVGYWLLNSILFIINFPFVVVRGVVAAALVLISLPVIAIVHGISLVVASNLKEKAKRLQVTPYKGEIKQKTAIKRRQFGPF